MNPLMTTGADWRAGPTALSVNLNRVALLRNSRPLDIPNLDRAAVLALEGGANGITVHPRPDERHIRARDVHDAGRAAAPVAAGRVQHRRQPVPQPDAVRARAAAAPVHLRTGQ